MKHSFLILNFLLVLTSCNQYSESENENVKNSIEARSKEDSISLKLKEIDSLIKANEKVIENLKE